MQHEGSANAGIDGRMRAGKQQAEPLIGEVRFVCDCSKAVGHGLKIVGLDFASLSAHGVEKLVARDREQPCFRIHRAAIARPVGKRSREGIGERILCSIHIARACGEIRDELAVAVARDSFSGSARLLVVGIGTHLAPLDISQMARTSTTPWPTPGHRPAHESAASRSGTSMT